MDKYIVHIKSEDEFKILCKSVDQNGYYYQLGFSYRIEEGSIRFGTHHDNYRGDIQFADYKYVTLSEFLRWLVPKDDYTCTQFRVGDTVQVKPSCKWAPGCVTTIEKMSCNAYMCADGYHRWDNDLIAYNPFNLGYANTCAVKVPTGNTDYTLKASISTGNSISTIPQSILQPILNTVDVSKVKKGRGRLQFTKDVC